MALDADIYARKDALGGSLAVSVTLHGMLLAAVFVLPALLGHVGNDWGNNGSGGATGEAMSARLVSGIPLPANPDAKPENVLANESKGLSKSLPSTPAKPDDNAIAIPDRNARTKPPKHATTPADEGYGTERATPSPTTAKNTPPADNTVPFGSGGPVAAPYTSFSSGGTQGGLQFGDGGFGSRFGWYTDVVARKVHDAWQNEVNPSVTSAKRVYILFDISRAGTPSNVRVEQSSGIPSLDIAATRALQRIDTFGPLPAGYSGSYVSVEFWFDYRR